MENTVIVVQNPSVHNLQVAQLHTQRAIFIGGQKSAIR